MDQRRYNGVSLVEIGRVMIYDGELVYDVIKKREKGNKKRKTLTKSATCLFCLF